MKGIFLDIETTGLNPLRHRAINIAFKVIDLQTGDVEGAYDTIVRQPKNIWDDKDPMSIAINGFTWEKLEKGKDVEAIGNEIVSMFDSLKIQRGKAVFICQNPSFDRGFFNQLVDVYRQEMLNWPYHWLDLASMFWAMFSFKSFEKGVPLPEKMSLSKNEIAKYFGLPPEEEPHIALRGVDHLILCYHKVIKSFSEE